MTGDQIGTDLIEPACRELKVEGFHFRDSRKAIGKGWPDWVFLGRQGILFAEVKGRGDKVTGRQRAVGYSLQALGLPWQAWEFDKFGRDFLAAVIRSQLVRIADPAVITAIAQRKATQQ